MIPDIYMCGIMAQSASISAISGTVGNMLSFLSLSRCQVRFVGAWLSLCSLPLLMMV